MNKKGKQVLEAYIADMEEAYKWNQGMQVRWLDGLFDADESMDDFDFHGSVVFTRVWDIIMHDLGDSERNLYLMFCAVFGRYNPLMEMMGEKGSSIATLRVMVCNVKKKIREIYDKRYKGG